MTAAYVSNESVRHLKIAIRPLSTSVELDHRIELTCVGGLSVVITGSLDDSGEALQVRLTLVARLRRYLTHGITELGCPLLAVLQLGQG